MIFGKHGIPNPDLFQSFVHLTHVYLKKKINAFVWIKCIKCQLYRQVITEALLNQKGNIFTARKNTQNMFTPK